MQTIHWLTDEIFTEGRTPFFLGRCEELHTLTHLLTGTQPALVELRAAAGMGKTSLVHQFALSNRDFFSGGFLVLSCISGPPVDHMMARLTDVDFENASLVLIDDAECVSTMELERIVSDIRTARPNSRIIVSSRLNIGNANLGHILDLKGINEHEFRALIGTTLSRSGLDENRLFAALGGSPQIAKLLQSAKGSPRALLELLSDFELNGLVTIDGQPLREIDAPRIIQSTEIGDAMIRELQLKPHLIYELEPRKFEELVAETLNRLGFDVQLTPKSKDKGRDILANLKTDLCNHLYLVECKKYRPDRPVEVALVRQLFGTVQSENATSGIMVTTSRFTKGAKEFQQKHQYQLELKDYVDINDWLNRAMPKGRPIITNNS